MVFVLAKNEPALFVMLSESDVSGMRAGSTRFVDKRQLKGATFDHVIVSLHKSDTEALETLRTAGYRVPQLVNPEPVPGEGRCDACNGCIATPLLFEGRCTICWATEAKAARVARN